MYQFSKIKVNFFSYNLVYFLMIKVHFEGHIVVKEEDDDKKKEEKKKKKKDKIKKEVERPGRLVKLVVEAYDDQGNVIHDTEPCCSKSRT